MVKIESSEETSHHIYFSQTVFRIMVVIIEGIVNECKTLKSHLIADTDNDAAQDREDRLHFLTS